ncbi:hypothetical protein BST81_14260 [Leptolyngbya sp. 'hensonii']|uniref:hypothetical protein n=1 Tax=Leptolyngbya sp. 'hensonii' TaxID=1922337 RepID=UPI00094FA9D6|nr:hypothetical protein [Leptolyngbya sp. 'hensonii']OLP17499.1 hypothetical protein BST81_14260 [Leptolyngbya sp. 'hensonii']
MNSDNLFQLLQKGFRISLGAAASVIETLQDPQKRNQGFTQLSEQWSQLSEEWATKGAATEQEARNFVDTFWAHKQEQQRYPASSPLGADGVTVRNGNPDAQVELEALTAQIAALRAEVERLRNEN